MELIRVSGAPAAALRRPGQRAWRQRVADGAVARGRGRGAEDRSPGPRRAVRLDFEVRPRGWVDLDSLVEVALAGLRDAGVFSRGYPQLDLLVATKRVAETPGLVVRSLYPVDADGPVPGAVALEATGEALPAAGRLADKRAWRGRVAAAWGATHPLDGPVWVDVALRTPGSLLGPLEPVLDALEPCLGRDPRGQPRQEFFPRDDLVTWLRVRRAPPPAPALRLRLGPLDDG
ncbi:hypothetical protein BH20ACT9_BH20ACT9_04370 [soil metagenome]